MTIIKSEAKAQKVFSEIDRFYGDEDEKIKAKKTEKKMDVSMPMFMIGFKDLSNVGKLKAGMHN